ncbi:HD domain-containing protein [Candidatus Desantisbacteria bacterium]|nr:HD domain-containing protein [Candidatus Desantisbacteria bacterium]
MNTYSFLQLFVSFFYLYISIFILQLGNDQSKYSFIILCLSLCVFSFGHSNLSTPGISDDMVFFWIKISVIGLVFILPGYLHFIAMLLNYKPLLEHKLHICVYAVSFGFILPLILSHKNINLYSWGYYPEITPVVSLFHLFLFLILGEVIYILYSEKARIKEMIGQRMSRYLLLGGICSVVLVILNILPVYKVKVYPAGNIIIFPYVLFLSYLILRYQLISITSIKKREVHSLTAGLLMTILVSGVLYLNNLLIKENSNSSLLSGSTIILSLIMVMAFKPLHALINKVVDYLFFRKNYMHTIALQKFTQGLSTTLSREVLLDSMLYTLEQIADTNVILIMVMENNRYKIVQAKGMDEDVVHKTVFSLNHPMVSALMEKKDIVLLKEAGQEGMKRYFGETQTAAFLPIMCKDDLLGIIGIGRKRYGVYNDDDLLRLSTFSISAGLGMINASLYEEQTRHLYEGIKILAQVLEAKDTYTHGHCERVAEISLIIGHELKLSESQIEDLRMAAMLHDIGKIGISKQILNKPGFLTQEEFMEIKKHPAIGEKIVEGIKFPKDVHDGIRLHHERFDGNGYPDGKGTTDCPLLAKIIQVADAYEAMTSNRPYRNAMCQEDALDELKKGKAKQFDPDIVDAFLKVMVGDR